MSTYDDSSGVPATPEKALCGSVSEQTIDITLDSSDGPVVVTVAEAGGNTLALLRIVSVLPAPNTN
jgi:ABC-type arginine transport system ATPase subunit